MKTLSLFLVSAALFIGGGAALADKHTRADKAEVLSISIAKSPLPDGGGEYTWNICGHVPYQDGGWAPAQCPIGKWEGDDVPSIMRGKALQLWKHAVKP